MASTKWPKWLVLVAVAAAPSCKGCGCKCFSFDGEFNCSPVFDSGIGGAGGGTSSGTQTPPCVGCACCLFDEVCWDGECLAAGGACHGSGDCAEGWMCDFTLEGAAIEATLVGGDDCASLPVGVCVPLSPSPCGLSSALDPVALAPVAAWGDPNATLAEHSVVGQPAVIQLDDDNCDGVVDAHDVAEIVFATAAQGASPLHGSVHAYRLVDGALEALWTTLAAVPANDPASAIAAARTPWGDAVIAICTEDERIRAYDDAGVERWTGAPSARCDSLAIADVDFDGVLEVVSESQIVSVLDGSEVGSYGPAPSHGFAVFNAPSSDVMGMVTANRIYTPAGDVVVDLGGADGFVALSEYDRWLGVDPVAHTLRVGLLDGTVFNEIDLHAPFAGACPPGTAGALASGGPPSVGSDRIGVTSALGYAVYDGVGNLLWAVDDPDCDAPTRASLMFDFDGDGADEVVRYLEQRMQLRDGATGALLSSWCNTVEAGHAYPLVADVDADGFGELLGFASARTASTCDGGAQAGLQVLRGDVPVARTRSVYNEFSYRVDNVTDDGVAFSDFGGYAPFMRANRASLKAPNLTIEHIDCDLGARVRVRNVGNVALAARQATVSFHDETDLIVGRAVIPVTLAPGAGIDVRLQGAPAMLSVEVASIHGRPLGECNVGDNAIDLSCP